MRSPRPHSGTFAHIQPSLTRPNAHTCAHIKVHNLIDCYGTANKGFLSVVLVQGRLSARVGDWEWITENNSKKREQKTFRLGGMWGGRGGQRTIWTLQLPKVFAGRAQPIKYEHQSQIRLLVSDKSGQNTFSCLGEEAFFIGSWFRPLACLGKKINK